MPSRSPNNGWKSCVKSKRIFNREHPRKASVIPQLLLTSVNESSHSRSSLATKLERYRSKWENLNQKTNPKVIKDCHSLQRDTVAVTPEEPRGTAASAGRTVTCCFTDCHPGSLTHWLARPRDRTLGRAEDGYFKQHPTGDHHSSRMTLRSHTINIFYGFFQLEV